MPLFTKANAKYHCRTCLLKLRDTEYDEFPHTSESLNLTTNFELQNLLYKYVAEVCGVYDDYPDHVCLACFRKLEDFEKFCNAAKENWSNLRAILHSNGVSKMENEEGEGNEERPTDEPEINNEDIYKLLLKDSLMETETVLLANTPDEAMETVDTQDPDPFEATKECQEFDWPGNEEESRSEGSGEEVQEEENAQGREEEDTGASGNEESRKAQTRSGVKKKHRPSQLGTEQPHKQIKRRNKGTRNTFKCDQCSHCFAHKITLDAHVRKVHEGSKRPFQCDRCDKAYTFIGGLYTHIKEIHETAERSYTCDFAECGRNYTSFIAMQKHKRLKHSDQAAPKKYVCEQCGSTFNQSGNLKYHRRTKHPTAAEQAEREKSAERFECELCQKLFHSRYTLKYHTLQLHSHDTKYECHVCGRRMAKKFMLVQHMLVHSKDKMPCEHCGKQFIRKFELEAHIRAVHMKLKPFECQYCSECFASRKTLRHHEYIHTGEKPYVCDICGQAYRQQTCLKNHRKSHEKLSAIAGLAPMPLSRSIMQGFLGEGVEKGDSEPPVVIEPPPPPDCGA